MPSIISGFDYDIFISYRHNDNLDGWVSDFVQDLEKELKGTLKDSLTIYFDKNPQDGLLETHNVDKSLEGKLRKSFIFIPIISQTYCDTKSFAWEHEFRIFNKLSNEDPLGKDITLGNGNVTSRILPIKIHELEAEDKSILENELGGALRAIEFVYKEPGVNRPLKPIDSKTDNQNKTDYRNQVNKVANSIKDITHAIQGKSLSQETLLSNQKERARKFGIKAFSITALILILIAVAWIYFNRPLGQATDEVTEILDRAEKYMEEGDRFSDARYYINAYNAIQKALKKDPVNERALYLMALNFSNSDSSKKWINKIVRINPKSKYGLLGLAGIDARKHKLKSAINYLEAVISLEPSNKDALRMLCKFHWDLGEFITAWGYAKKYETYHGVALNEMLSELYLELGDFVKAEKHFRLKQEQNEFSCGDIELLQRIYLCAGKFEKLERLTDSICKETKCDECYYWQLRAKAHTGKYKEADRFVREALKKAPKIAWRLPAFVLMKNDKKDSAQLIADAEIKFDQMRLADTTYHQAMPLYSLAAIHAMRGNKTESLKWLREYYNRGFEMGSEWYIAHDPLFDEVQKDHEYFADFIQIIEKVQALKNAQREQLRLLENAKPN